MKPKELLKITSNSSNKKIYFEDNGKASEKVEQIVKTPILSESSEIKPQKKKFKKHDGEDLGMKWYQAFEEHNTEEQTEIKDTEMRMFEEHCKKCFNDEIENFKKSKLNFLYF